MWAFRLPPEVRKPAAHTWGQSAPTAAGSQGPPGEAQSCSVPAEMQAGPFEGTGDPNTSTSVTSGKLRRIKYF